MPTLLFDLDGTLVDTAADFVAILSTMCEQQGILPPSAEVIRNTVSDGARALVTLCFQVQENQPEFTTLQQTLLERYALSVGQAATLFNGMQEVLLACAKQQNSWGIITNKPWRFTEPLIQQIFSNPEHRHLAPKSIICPEHVSSPKPNPEGILLACEQLAVAPEHCLYIGDHRRDIEAGKNANMPTVACRYGYVKPDDQIVDWQADYIIDKPIDLLRLL